MVHTEYYHKSLLILILLTFLSLITLVGCPDKNAKNTTPEDKGAQNMLFIVESEAFQHNQKIDKLSSEDSQKLRYLITEMYGE